MVRNNIIEQSSLVNVLNEMIDYNFSWNVYGHNIYKKNKLKYFSLRQLF